MIMPLDSRRFQSRAGIFLKTLAFSKIQFLFFQLEKKIKWWLKASLSEVEKLNNIVCFALTCGP